MEVLADILMENFEDKALTDEEVITWTRVLKRFEEDVISVVKKNKSSQLLSYLNTQHKKIKFTMVEEKDGWIGGLPGN